MDHVSFMFNTEYEGSPPDGNNAVQVLDAVAQLSWGDEINIWAGRFLPPSDRANLYGPYYANQWAVYRDGVQDGFPSTAVGRDNGVMYWGQFGIVKVAVGAFDVPSTVGTSNVVSSARVMVDLWDKEAGYYLNGTYYGDKDLLAIGIDGQSVGRQQGVLRGLPAGEETAELRRSRRRVGIREVRPFRRLRGRHEQRLLRARELHVPTGRGRRQVPTARQVRARELHVRHGPEPHRHAEDGRRGAQLHHQAIQRPRESRTTSTSSTTTTSPASTTKWWDSACSSRCDLTNPIQGNQLHETQTNTLPGAAAGLRPGALGGGERRGHHQGRRPALAVGHHGHQRDDAEGHGPDAHR